MLKWCAEGTEDITNWKGYTMVNFNKGTDILLFDKHIEIEQLQGERTNSIDIYVNEIPNLIKLLHAIKRDYIKRDQRVSK